jgi:hypothetical protein
MNDIRNLESWTIDTAAENKKLGRLKMRAGYGLIDALESLYSQWQTKQTNKVQTEYMKWRVRLHRKWNGDPDFLRELDDSFKIGLCDETIGKILWDIPPEDSVNLSSSYNWRRDSGYALRGGSSNRSSASKSSDDPGRDS